MMVKKRAWKLPKIQDRRLSFPYVGKSAYNDLQRLYLVEIRSHCAVLHDDPDIRLTPVMPSP